MVNSIQRTITGTVVVLIVITAIVFGTNTFFGLCFLINFLALVEFYKLFKIDQNKIRWIFGLTLSIILISTSYLFITKASDWKILLISVPFAQLLFLEELWLKSEAPFQTLALTFLGIIYITIPLVLLFAVSQYFLRQHYNGHILLAYFLFLWGNDTGAYIVGTLFGKTPLARQISPNKTWEGSIGGALVVGVIAWLNNKLFPDIHFWDWLALGSIVIVMGTLGDLVKSTMKRSLKVKDCGTILPGHGGILDRFDSLIGSVPLVYLYAILQL